MRHLGTVSLCVIGATISIGCNTFHETQAGAVGEETPGLVGRPGTDSGPPSGSITPDDRALLDRLHARELALARLRGKPGDFIHAEVQGTQDRGFFDSRTRAKALLFRNASSFDVSDIKGHISFNAEDGQELGSVPFVSAGLVYAGQASVLEVKSGELTGRGTVAQVTIDAVHAWE